VTKMQHKLKKKPIYGFLMYLNYENDIFPLFI